MELQKELEKIIKTVEKNGWQVSVTGDQKIRYIKKDGEDMKELVDLINQAMKDVQKDSAKKRKGSGVRTTASSLSLSPHFHRIVGTTFRSLIFFGLSVPSSSSFFSSSSGGWKIS